MWSIDTDAAHPLITICLAARRAAAAAAWPGPRRLFNTLTSWARILKRSVLSPLFFRTIEIIRLLLEGGPPLNKVEILLMCYENNLNSLYQKLLLQPEPFESSGVRDESVSENRPWSSPARLGLATDNIAPPPLPLDAATRPGEVGGRDARSHNMPIYTTRKYTALFLSVGGILPYKALREI